MMNESKRPLWLGTLLVAGLGALATACGPQDGGSANSTMATAVAAAPVPPPAANPAPVAEPAPAPVVAAPAPAPVAKPAPVRVAKAAAAAKPIPVKAQAAATVAAAPPAHTVGAVKQIDPITETTASGVGAVAGGALGGVLGHQFGKGDGKKAMTVLGAVGGAVAGHQVEKARNTKVVGYRVQVQLDNGETRTFEPTQLDGLKVGDRVRVEQGQLRGV